MFLNLQYGFFGQGTYHRQGQGMTMGMFKSNRQVNDSFAQEFAQACWIE